MDYDLNKVKQAAKFLDKKHPGWYKKIDTFLLQMLSPRYCILGQLYGSSLVGREALNLVELDADELMNAFGYNAIQAA